MTLSHISIRLGSFAAAAVVTSAMLFAAVPSAFAASGPYYKVELAQQTTVQKQLVRGVFVKCEGTACRAPITSSASKNMCTAIAREFGEVTAFQAGDRVFDAAEVAACNQKNKVNIAKK